MIIWKRNEDDHDMNEQFNSYDNFNTNRERHTGFRDTFALFSLISGVVAIPMSLAIIPGILLGIAAITLGIISRINYEKFNLHNVLGITFGGIAIFLSSIWFLSTIMLLRDPETLSQIMEFMQMYYGH